MGKQVGFLPQGIIPGGKHRINWNGKDESGSQLEKGVYFYRLATEKGTIGNGSVLIIQ